uniref:Uncharacterized protein n=1 Tax=mine drainage metagenome TaxID=410659 RepID=E6PQN8_9ZZZZ
MLTTCSRRSRSCSGVCFLALSFSRILEFGRSWKVHISLGRINNASCPLTWGGTTAVALPPENRHMMVRSPIHPERRDWTMKKRFTEGAGHWIPA